MRPCIICMSVWLFFSRPRTSTFIHRLPDRFGYGTNAYDCCYSQEISLCDCLQAVNTAAALGGSSACNSQAKSCNAQTTNNTERRQWVAAVTSSASPAARTACSVRGAASHLAAPRHRRGAVPVTASARWRRVHAIDATLFQVDGVEVHEGLRKYPRVIRQTTQTRRHGHGRPQ